MKIILVTGAAGFIGLHLIQSLAFDTELFIVGIDNINDYYSTQLKYDRLLELGIDREHLSYGKYLQSSRYENVVFIKGDLTDRKLLKSIFLHYKPCIVCNLAAQAGVRYSFDNPQVYLDSNFTGFYNLIDFSSSLGVEHFIYASSSSVYGDSNKLPFSENNSTDYPVSLYAVTKKSNELLAYNYSRNKSLATTGLRFFTVYGPWGRPDMAYFSFTKKILNGESINLYNYGKMRRDFTYIDDIVRGIKKVIFRFPTNIDNPKGNPPYQIYNMGSSAPVRLLDFVEILETTLQKKASLKLSPMQLGDMVDTWADISHAKNDLEFKINWHIKEGLKVFVDWFYSYYSL